MTWLSQHVMCVEWGLVRCLSPCCASLMSTPHWLHWRLQHGADVNRKNRDGHTALDLVKESDQDVADLLRGDAALLDAAKKGNLARVQKLLNPDNINCRDSQVRNVLVCGVGDDSDWWGRAHDGLLGWWVVQVVVMMVPDVVVGWWVVRVVDEVVMMIVVGDVVRVVMRWWWWWWMNCVWYFDEWWEVRLMGCVMGGWWGGGWWGGGWGRGWGEVGEMVNFCLNFFCLSDFILIFLHVTICTSVCLYCFPGISVCVC